MNATATLTSKGQVTVPRAIRKALGLDAGSQLSFELEGGDLRIRPISSKSWTDLWELANAAPMPGGVVDVDKAIQAEVRNRSKR